MSLKLVLVGMPVPPPPPGEDNPDLYIPDIVKQFITHFYTQVVDKVCLCVCLHANYDVLIMDILSLTQNMEEILKLYENE